MPLTMGSGMSELRVRLKELTSADVKRLPARDRAAAQSAVILDDEPLRALLAGSSPYDAWDSSSSGAGFLVLCGRGGCGGRLGYVRTVPAGLAPEWFPPEHFLDRDGTWGLSNRAQAGYDRQRRATGFGEVPRDRHPHTPGPGRRRRPASLETLDTGARAFGIITVPRLMRPGVGERGLAFPPEGFRVRCPDCRRPNRLTPP